MIKEPEGPQDGEEIREDPEGGDLPEKGPGVKPGPSIRISKCRTVEQLIADLQEDDED